MPTCGARTILNCTVHIWIVVPGHFFAADSSGDNSVLIIMICTSKFRSYKKLGLCFFLSFRKNVMIVGLVYRCQLFRYILTRKKFVTSIPHHEKKFAHFFMGESKIVSYFPLSWLIPF